MNATATATATLTRWTGRRAEAVTVSLHRDITGWWAVNVSRDGRRDRGMSTEEWAPQFEVFRAKVEAFQEDGWRVAG